jgi:chemotaxis methyl-accepting protein methylase
VSESADDAAFVALTAKICRDRGFGAPNYKDSCMRRRIAVRMRARGAADFDAYSGLLDRDPAEYEWLIAALTIHVTRLFRNLDAWEAVEREVLPALGAAPAAQLDCLVAGCASGEEAYTLAALWLRFASALGDGATARLRVTASDIDAQSLAAAEAGSYADDAFTETPAGMRERWFRASEPAGRWTAGPELRSLVRFERRDLLQEPPPAAEFRLITCRNVIIYFDRPSQEALLRRFHDALVPGGFLMLGKVETLLGPSRALFDAVDTRQRIFRRR